MSKPYPDFVIAGAMKSGTTALANLLNSHDAIEMAIPKEPSLLMRSNYEEISKGFKVIDKEDIEKQYSLCFKGFSKKSLWGEASVAYFADADSPEIIFSRNKNAKIIIMLREPVSRAISSFFYLKSRFDEKSESIGDALHDEILGNRNNYWPTLRHIHYSKYHIHLRNWYKVFPNNNIKLIEFEDFKKNPYIVTKDIFNFLELDTNNIEIKIKHQNKTVITENKIKLLILNFLYQPNLIKRFIKKFIPLKVLKNLKVQTQDYLANNNISITVKENDKNILNKELADIQQHLENEFNFHPKFWKNGS